MHRLRLLVSPLLILAGCTIAGAEAPAPAGATPAPPTLPLDAVRVGFPPGGLADVIRIDAAYRLPLRSAELVAPDGEVTPASSVDTTDSPRFAAGQSVANDPWKTGIADTVGGGTSALGSGLPNPALRSRVQVMTIVSTASIPLPDPAAYRQDWQHYRIRLGFGVPPGRVEASEMPAPEPPPPPSLPPAR